MIRISQLKLATDSGEQQLYKKAAKALKIKPEQIKKLSVARKSIDARKKPELWMVYTVDVSVDGEEKIVRRAGNRNAVLVKPIRYLPPEHGNLPLAHRPLVVGAGPAGLFAAYLLAKEGYAPFVAERGRRVEERAKDVQAFWETGILDTVSNVQFGEGGAGAFSDGKLNTLVKDTAGRNRFVLETFVKFGAPEEILSDAKPHIGTDILAGVIAAMREEIIRLGGTFSYETCVTGIEYEKIEENTTESHFALRAVELNGKERLTADVCIFAPGHSARDTFEMLCKTPLVLQPKAFAAGFRVEHPQDFINQSQYGAEHADDFGAAPYKVTANFPNGRSAYSFCMCPGGYVVNASSEEGRLAVNGMSYFDRGGKNANSAIIVTVTPEDFDGTDALAGVRFQRKLEEAAYALGGGKIPQQLFGDYCDGKASDAYGAFSSETKGEHTFANLRGLFPREMEEAFIGGMHAFAAHIPDFDRRDAILSAVESRTSSPVRILRNAEFEADIAGIYPCGEGAGYAGGITSAAMDGLKAAEAVIRRYRLK